MMKLADPITMAGLGVESGGEVIMEPGLAFILAWCTFALSIIVYMSYKALANPEERRKLLTFFKVIVFVLIFMQQRVSK